MTRKDAPKTRGGASDYLTCSATGKRGYTSKSSARKARGQTPAGGSPLSVYRCPSCSLYHLGHLPPSVRRGEREKS